MANKRPWMPLYVADYLADTLDLSTEGTAVYLLMLMLAWRRPDGALPNNMKWLKRALASCVNDMHGNRFNRLVPSLLEQFFVLSEDGKFRNKRLTKEREKSEKFSGKQKENADKRWAKIKENKDLEDAKAMPARALHSHSHSQSQEESKKETRASALLPGFETFWFMWPNKVGKPAALKAFRSAIGRAASLEAILNGVEVYSRDKPADRPWLNPATYLNQDRWKDQPATVSIANGKPRNGIIQAADDLCRKIAEFDGPPREPDELRSETGQTVVRLLPNGRRQ